jgi:hypothetical protein
VICVSAPVEGESAPKTVIDWVYWKAEDRSKADLGLRGRWSDTSSGHAQETRSLGGQEGGRQQSVRDLQYHLRNTVEERGRYTAPR